MRQEPLEAVKAPMQCNFSSSNSFIHVCNSILNPPLRHVKLISSDGHEFIVSRDHALTSGFQKLNHSENSLDFSGTIKAMLSGPGQFAENETNEVDNNFLQ